MTRPRVYLAGPDVFRPDAEQHFAMLAAVCERNGLEALSPFDLSVDITSARAIYEANMAKLQAADGVVANLAPFRGEQPDSGTVFEVGVAAARGVPVVGYGTQELAPGLAGAVALAESAEEAIRVMAVALSLP
uniref:Nucleoside 2-deoxyribosyltransferase n=1 Tax=Variovorax sp. HH01 TaxID=1084736 RepID=I3PCM5_9BURK|nr:nucleoside 2-deoxyribosyltransferase [Variovorax sp. HH01]